MLSKRSSKDKNVSPSNRSSSYNKQHTSEMVRFCTSVSYMSAVDLLIIAIINGCGKRGAHMLNNRSMGLSE